MSPSSLCPCCTVQQTLRPCLSAPAPLLLELDGGDQEFWGHTCSPDPSSQVRAPDRSLCSARSLPWHLLSRAPPPLCGLFSRAPQACCPQLGGRRRGANAVLCCAGAGFRTTGPEDPCQSASNSSPEPRKFPDDKPQVSVRLLLSALPGLSFGGRPCLGGPSLTPVAVGSLVPGKPAQNGSCWSSAGWGLMGCSGILLGVRRCSGVGPRVHAYRREQEAQRLGARRPGPGASHPVILLVSLEVGRDEPGPRGYMA